MNKFKFIKYKDTENEYDVSKIVFTTETLLLGEIVTQFEYFLKACGFHFDGHLEFVDEEPKSE